MQSKYYIGYSTDSILRYDSSSGGIGSALIKYLLESGLYGTSMTIVFDSSQCLYYPKLIYSFSEYNNCGSIYQDIDIIHFIKDNIDLIKNGMVITCMPCQVKAVKSILSRCNIKHFIISLCCSGQTTIQGTWYYYKLLGIKKEEVAKIQYRGKGWPSGIQIELKNGDVIRKNNYTYPWTLMHKSLLFRPKRCFSCTIKTSQDADISLADPWLKEFIEKDHTGNSVVISNKTGEEVINEMLRKRLIVLKEVGMETYIQSQLGTIQVKSKANNYKKYNKVLGKISKEGSLYKTIFTSSVLMLRVHLKLLHILQVLLKH